MDPVSQVFSRIRSHLERTQAQQLSWAQLMDLMGTSFKVRATLSCMASLPATAAPSGAHLLVWDVVAVAKVRRRESRDLGVETAVVLGA